MMTTGDMTPACEQDKCLTKAWDIQFFVLTLVRLLFTAGRISYTDVLKTYQTCRFTDVHLLQ